MVPWKWQLTKLVDMPLAGHPQTYRMFNETGLEYFGSTTKVLAERLGEHIKKARATPNRKVYAAFSACGWENVKIEVVKDEADCEDLASLRLREDALIRLHLGQATCLNMRAEVRSSLDKKAYVEGHRSLYCASSQKYYAACPRLTCPDCGSSLHPHYRFRHAKTKKHLASLSRHLSDPLSHTASVFDCIHFG